MYATGARRTSKGTDDSSQVKNPRLLFLVLVCGSLLTARVIRGSIATHDAEERLVCAALGGIGAAILAPFCGPSGAERRSGLPSRLLQPFRSVQWASMRGLVGCLERIKFTRMTIGS